MSKCATCITGCACLGEGAQCEHTKCGPCHKCRCCCAHSPTTTMSVTVPLCYAGGDLACTEDVVQHGLGRGVPIQWKAHRTIVPWAVGFQAMRNVRCRSLSSWSNATVLAVCDVEGGVGDKILLGQALHAAAKAGARIFGLRTTEAPKPVSLEVERLFWPEFTPVKVEDFSGPAGLRRLGDFTRVVASLKMPVDVALRAGPTFAAAVHRGFGLHPVLRPPAALPARPAGLPPEYLVLHVGAHTQGFADEAALKVALRHAAAMHLPVVAIGSPDACGGRILDETADLRGALTLGEDTVVVAGAVAGYGPDSAMAHVAGVCGAKFVALVDPAVPWLSRIGHGWWLGHYPTVRLARIELGL